MALVQLKPGALDAPATGAAEKVFNFATGRHYRATLSVSGNFNQGASGSGDATALEDSPFTLLTNVEVKSRLGTFIRATGQQLYHLSLWEDRVAPTGSAPAPSGAGDSAFSFKLPIPFSPATGVPNGLRVPDALIADLRDGTEPKIVIAATTADLGLATGNTRTHTINGLAYDLMLEDEDEPVSPKYVRTLESIVKPVSASQSDFQIDLTSRKGRRQRAIHLLMHRASVRSNSLANGRIRLLRASGQAFFETTLAELQEANKRILGATMAAGTAVIDFDTMRLLARLPMTETFSAYKLELSVSASGSGDSVSVLTDNVIDRDSFGV